MPGLTFDSDEGGSWSLLSRLKCGSKFKGMRGNHPVIVVGSDDQSRWVFCRLQVVVGRIAEEVFEVGGIVGFAVFRLSGPADGEFVKTKHVHDSHRREAGSIEVWSLDHACANKESAV